MVKDRFNIEMENVSGFLVERSADYEEWEALSHEELKKELTGLPEEKLKAFFGAVRNGSTFKLKDHYYRIKAV
ncbi:MAG: hypothetical protein HY579_07790 [Nitrospinae bacterium]|nr:hypothetical protein [Nitrospinota bacterium]